MSRDSSLTQSGPSIRQALTAYTSDQAYARIMMMLRCEYHIQVCQEADQRALAMSATPPRQGYVLTFRRTGSEALPQACDINRSGSK